MHVATLKDMIRINNPDLFLKISNLLNEKKRLMPPVVIADIFKTIGNPE